MYIVFVECSWNLNSFLAQFKMATENSKVKRNIQLFASHISLFASPLAPPKKCDFKDELREDSQPNAHILMFYVPSIDYLISSK